jgi:predicted DsbA family dithiol-disulfide isomerase
VRLDDVAEHFGDQIDITWKSFMLRTEPKTTSRDKFVRYTEGWKTMAELEPRAAFSPWATDNEPPSTSLPAQVAHKVAAANWPDKDMDMHHALLTAYFTDNRTISDWQVLADIAADVGIDRDEYLAMVGEQRQQMAQLVVDEHNEAINQGITAVPTVLINQVLPVPGAQETETYVNWIQRLIDRETP